MSEEKKGLSPLAWVGIGCGALVVIAIVVVVGVGWWGVHKLKQAGFDPELWQKNPAQAAAKVITTVNPDLEVVKVDEDEGTITVRNTRTGEEVTLDLDDVKKGRVRIEAKGGEEAAAVTIGEGGVTVKTDEGTVRIGGGVQHPDWVPLYPGATTTEGGMTSQGDGEVGGLISQTTGDDPATVAGHFKGVLAAQGYEVSSTLNESGGKVSSATVTGKKADEGREINVIVYSSGDTTRITINYAQREGDG